MTADGWKEIGAVWVDAACVMILDPSYIRDGNVNPKDVGKAIDSMFDGNRDGIGRIEIDTPNGTPFIAGVVVPSAGGDGCYPVSIRYQDGHLAEVRVMFVDDEGRMAVPRKSAVGRRRAAAKIGIGKPTKIDTSPSGIGTPRKVVDTSKIRPPFPKHDAS